MTKPVHPLLHDRKNGSISFFRREKGVTEIEYIMAKSDRGVIGNNIRHRNLRRIFESPGDHFLKVCPAGDFIAPAHQK